MVTNNKLHRDRVAVVTGGGTGIGLAIAKSLAAVGAQVTIASRNTDSVTTAASQIEGVTGKQLDVSDQNSVMNFFEDIGRIDILVNNAGIARSAPFEKTTSDEWSDMIATNLTGTFNCIRAVLPGMKKSKFGRIVNIASVAGLKGYAYTAAYTASKHGVIGLTRSLSLELANTHVTVNSVCPGFTNTNIVANAVDVITGATGRSESEALADLVKNNPQKRLIEPQEVAATVLWLCDEASGSITGQSIVVAGGECM